MKMLDIELIDNKSVICKQLAAGQWTLWPDSNVYIKNGTGPAILVNHDVVGWTMANCPLNIDASVGFIWWIDGQPAHTMRTEAASLWWSAQLTKSSIHGFINKSVHGAVTVLGC